MLRLDRDAGQAIPESGQIGVHAADPIGARVSRQLALMLEAAPLHAYIARIAVWI